VETVIDSVEKGLERWDSKDIGKRVVRLSVRDVEPMGISIHVQIYSIRVPWAPGPYENLAEFPLNPLVSATSMEGEITVVYQPLRSGQRNFAYITLQCSSNLEMHHKHEK
jgi:hypothetical protein